MFTDIQVNTVLPYSYEHTATPQPLLGALGARICFWYSDSALLITRADQSSLGAPQASQKISLVLSD
jgi:hypothetical protein